MALLSLLRPMAAPSPAHAAHTAIIDIGSNSVRLVVYSGPLRLPSVVFNEKVLAGLGGSLSRTGSIDRTAMSMAATAIARFAWLTREMKVSEVRTVATAAVRDASNGSELIALAAAEGLEVEVLPGEAEAIGAGYGVLSAFPDADGIVGDLGGGSLELVRVSRGEVRERTSFPLGVLRIAAIRDKGKGALERHVTEALKESGWTAQGKGLPFYLVGGSWRALTQFDMHLTEYPLPIVNGYAMSRERIRTLANVVATATKQELKAVPNLSSGRIPTLAGAAVLLSSVLDELGCERTVTSSFGLREGLLYQALSPEARRQDPLLAAARAEAHLLSRFEEHGDLLNRWIAALFPDELPERARLRHTACLLADVGWHANPDFRAERGVEIALHGQWVGIDAEGRAMVAQALHTALGGGNDTPAPLATLAHSATLDTARRWGLAIRLGQRLSGGVAAPLERTRLEQTDDAIRLRYSPADAALYGEAVQKRHRALANAFGLEAAVG
ncbi:Ppx/GppA family phosphatase [Sphingomonas sp. 3-13AW]|uniref:Ppx/GppA phosphatase family protein n=1 Tax=Sphingomonas sp. 3-13AW TaxID=3050450 RepID=UPI003BB5A8DD